MTKKSYKIAIIILSSIALLLLVLNIVCMVQLNRKNKDIEQPAETVVPIETVEPEVVSDGAIDSDLLNAYKLPELTDDTVYGLVEYDLELLKQGYSSKIAEYFGRSETIDSTNFSELLEYTKISKIDSKKNNDNTQVIHICTVDTDTLNKEKQKIKDAAIERNSAISDESIVQLTKKALSKNIKKYKKCYQIVVKKKDGKLVITEELKSAITGKWYKGIGIDINNVRCEFK